MHAVAAREQRFEYAGGRRAEDITPNEQVPLLLSHEDTIAWSSGPIRRGGQAWKVDSWVVNGRAVDVSASASQADKDRLEARSAALLALGRGIRLALVPQTP